MLWRLKRSAQSGLGPIQRPAPTSGSSAAGRGERNLRAAFSKRPAYYFFFEEDFLLGTFAPAFRASDSPIAIACFLLVTFLPDRPLFRVPSFRSCIAFSTLSEAFLPYLAMLFLPPLSLFDVTFVRKQ